MAQRQRTWKATLTCVGLQFRWKADVRKMMPGWCPFPVTLEREPDNKHDPDAIKVVIAADNKLRKLRGIQLGYLSNRVVDGERVGLAHILAPKLDSGSIEPVKLWVTEISDDGQEATIDARFRDVKNPAAKRKTVSSSKRLTTD